MDISALAVLGVTIIGVVWFVADHCIMQASRKKMYNDNELIHDLYIARNAILSNSYNGDIVDRLDARLRSLGVDPAVGHVGQYIYKTKQEGVYEVINTVTNKVIMVGAREEHIRGLVEGLNRSGI